MTVDVRLDATDLQTLDEIAAARGHASRSAAVRDLIRDAAQRAAREPARLTRDDVLRCLERKIRDGNTAAARLWLAEIEKDAQEDDVPASPFADFDQPVIDLNARRVG